MHPDSSSNNFNSSNPPTSLSFTKYTSLLFSTHPPSSSYSSFPSSSLSPQNPSHNNSKPVTSTTFPPPPFSSNSSTTSCQKPTIREIERKYSKLKNLTLEISPYPKIFTDSQGSTFKSTSNISKEKNQREFECNSRREVLNPEQQNQLSPGLRKEWSMTETQPGSQFESPELRFRGNQGKGESPGEISSVSPFMTCKLTESNLYYLGRNEEMRVEESVVLRRSILDCFGRVGGWEKKEEEGEKEYLAVERNIGMMVSIKEVPIKGNLQNITNELNISHILGDHNNILLTYASFISDSKYIFIRQPYHSSIFLSLYPSFTQASTIPLLKQLLHLFSHLTLLKLQYKQPLLPNIYLSCNKYKLANFNHSTINREISESVLKRKYLRLIKEMLSEMLGVDRERGYYSVKLGRELEPKFVGFMRELGRNGVGFEELGRNQFLN